jgi:K+-sensing histidine kinase KdpD
MKTGIRTAPDKGVPMALVKKILAPTDFSDLSVKGVRYACQLAKEVGAALIVVNVVLLRMNPAQSTSEKLRNTNTNSMSFSRRNSPMSVQV